MNSFSVRTKIMTGGGLETLAPKLHRVFIVTDGFMSSSGKVSYITDVLHRGATVYQAEGLYKHTEKTVIMTAQGKKQALHLQDVIRQKDPHAFVLVTNTSEIIGKGFRGGN